MYGTHMPHGTRSVTKKTEETSRFFFRTARMSKESLRVRASPAASFACGGLRLTARLWLFRLQLAIANGLPDICVMFKNPKVRPISTEGFA